MPCDLYRWRPGDSSNPYFGILALSEALVVTADSVSMLSEACATGKPVYMADLAGSGYPMRPDSDLDGDFRLSALVYSGVMRFGHPRLSRDLRLVHRALREQGRAVWLGERFERPPPPLGEGVECTLDLPRWDEDAPPPLLRLGPPIDPGEGAVRTEGDGRAADGAPLGWRAVTEPAPLDRRGCDGRDGGCSCGRACGRVIGLEDGREDGRMTGDASDARGCTAIGLLRPLARVPPPPPR